MSNLTSTVKFDILRGWPNGGAVGESYPPTVAGTVYTEGQFLVLAEIGTTNVAGVVAPSAVTTSAAKVRLVIQGTDQFDGKFVGKVVTLRGPMTIKTEKFSSTGLDVGTPVTVCKETGKIGWLCAATAGSEGGVDYSTGAVLGIVEDNGSTGDGTITVALNF